MLNLIQFECRNLHDYRPSGNKASPRLAPGLANVRTIPGQFFRPMAQAICHRMLTLSIGVFFFFVGAAPGGPAGGGGLPWGVGWGVWVGVGVILGENFFARACRFIGRLLYTGSKCFITQKYYPRLHQISYCQPT